MTPRTAGEAAHGCPWNEETCHNAALMGNLDILKYAHESTRSSNGNPTGSAGQNGCEWHKYTCIYTLQKDSIECLKYTLENNCPHDKSELIRLAKQNNAKKCLEYLMKII
jgi:hypothetical protein